MLATGAQFWQVILAIHILAAVAGFGVTFAYPVFLITGAKLDPSAMPWFYRMMRALTLRLIYPGLILILICGIYLASHLHEWHAFYVQWGIAAVVVLGGIEGAVMAPRVRKLLTLSERDTAALASTGAGGSPAAGDFSWSDEYQSVFGQLSAAGGVQSLIVVVTIVLMALQVGGS